jgi:hypothetical protein
MYPNLDFWFENKPSGNPNADFSFLARKNPTNGIPTDTVLGNFAPHCCTIGMTKKRIEQYCVLPRGLHDHLDSAGQGQGRGVAGWAWPNKSGIKAFLAGENFFFLC